ncbi:MAG: LysR substrate-binding domain-containing protein [Actinomycetes bacterium]
MSFTYEGGPDDDLEGLAVRPLLEDALWLATPAGHPVPAARPAEGFSPQVAYATDDDVAVLGLVAAGLGVAVLPGLVLGTARRPDVDLVPLQPTSTRRVLAVTTPDLQRVPAVTAALDALGDAAGPLAVTAAGAGSPGSATGRPR